MLFFSLSIILTAVLASLLFHQLAKTLIADAGLRRLWYAFVGLIALVAFSQLIYLFLMKDDGFVVGLFATINMLMMLGTGVLLFKTIGYMRELNSINGIKIVDEATGAYNQTYLEQRLGNEVARCHRYGSPLSVVSLSVTGFPALQEEYGHQAGIVALKKIFGRLEALLRETDIITSQGNGRFVLILPDTPESSVDGLIIRLHGALDGLEVISGAKKERSVYINVKFGKSHCSLQTDSSEELVSRAVLREQAVQTGLQAVA